MLARPELPLVLPCNRLLDCIPGDEAPDVDQLVFLSLTTGSPYGLHLVLHSLLRCRCQHRVQKDHVVSRGQVGPRG